MTILSSNLTRKPGIPLLLQLTAFLTPTPSLLFNKTALKTLVNWTPCKPRVSLLQLVTASRTPTPSLLLIKTALKPLFEPKISLLLNLLTLRPLF